jgi:hypothetical protein
LEFASVFRKKTEHSEMQYATRALLLFLVVPPVWSSVHSHWIRSAVNGDDLVLCEVELLDHQFHAPELSNPMIKKG